MDKSRNPSVKKDGPAIIKQLTNALRDFSCLSNIDVAYGTPIANAPLPLDVIVDMLFQHGGEISFEKLYNDFHKRLHEEVGKIMPEHAGCWYVHEVISFRLSGGQIVKGGLVETFSYPEKNENKVEFRNLMND